MAGGAAAQRDAVRQAGGLHQFGHGGRPRAPESRPESSAHPGPESEGEGCLCPSGLNRYLCTRVAPPPTPSD